MRRVKTLEKLTVSWHKEPDWFAEHAAPCLRARSHLHAVGFIKVCHRYKGHRGVSVHLKLKNTFGLMFFPHFKKK